MHVDRFISIRLKGASTGQKRSIHLIKPCLQAVQWRNIGGLAKMAPLGGKKRPLVAPLGYKLTRSNF